MKFEYTFKLAPATEQVTRKATIGVNGQVETVVVKDNQLIREFAINEVVDVSFFDVDAAGNPSTPTVVLQNKTMVDDVAPEAPGVEICVKQIEAEGSTEGSTEQVEQEDGNGEGPVGETNTEQPPAEQEGVEAMQDTEPPAPPKVEEPTVEQTGSTVADNGAIVPPPANGSGASNPETSG